MAELPGGTVTFLATDIEESTARWERDAAAMGPAVQRHFELLRAAVDASDGAVFKTIGDAVLAAFPTALGAATAAVDAQRALRAQSWPAAVGPLRVRMALHTGEGVPDGDDYPIAPALNRLNRLLAAGHGEQVLLSAATYELMRDAVPDGATVRDLGEHRLKDLYRPERVFQLLAPDLPEAFPPLRTLEGRPTNLPAQPTPLVGREREVAEIVALLRGRTSAS